MGIHRWDGYVDYYEKAVNTIVHLLDNYCLDCHRGSFQIECPFEAEKIRVECGIGSALIQCIEYVENNDYLDDEEMKRKLDQIASLARELKDKPWEPIPEEERNEEKFAPILRRNSKFNQLKELATQISE
ncbi:hypothetical protein AKJ48_00225 [candidate division MSBL1 archaeon SCGC-AAA261O19]|uniref:Uncharacterized protein n=1 Tax=candidate division MSBL1 archaeon SCGC-AAA261O19 TaxID=1698277 RepID=A0A133VFA5_9EURY|nr:hypothetical protein AKJ48_00225 [candidate division MSBL1 archaeon SCGC-AAA261O19]